MTLIIRQVALSLQLSITPNASTAFDSQSNSTFLNVFKPCEKSQYQCYLCGICCARLGVNILFKSELKNRKPILQL